jgi:hypothetical protein
VDGLTGEPGVELDLAGLLCAGHDPLGLTGEPGVELDFETGGHDRVGHSGSADLLQEGAAEVEGRTGAAGVEEDCSGQ